MAAPEDDWSAPVAAPDNGADDWGTPVHAAPAPPQKPPVDPGILAQVWPGLEEAVTSAPEALQTMANPAYGLAEAVNQGAGVLGYKPPIPDDWLPASTRQMNRAAGAIGLGNPEDVPAVTPTERAVRSAVTMGAQSIVPGTEGGLLRTGANIATGALSGAASSLANEFVPDRFKPIVGNLVALGTGLGVGSATGAVQRRLKTPAQAELNDLASGQTQATAPAPPPQQAPAPDAVIGLKFPNAPSQRAVVDHYFDQGNSVRLRFDNGQVGDFLTTDVVRDLTQAPAPMQETPAPVPHGEPAGERPVFDEDDWSAPVKAVPPLPAAPVLDPEGLKALDHAQSLERTALNPTLNLTGSSRQDMLAEAARLRRQFGMAPDAAGPEPYRHPLANEPAAGLGELANARLRNPGLYAERPESPPPATEPAPEEEAPPAPASQYEQDRTNLAAMAAQRGITAEPDLAPPSDIDHALADVRFWKAPPKPGFSLFDYIRARGGIKNDPEVQALLQDYRNPPFKKRLMSPTGRPADDIRGALQEEGWFGHYDQNFPDSEAPGSDIQDFYDLIDKEARGERVYHPDDPDAHNADIHRMLDREMDAAGVSPFDKPADAARKLADFRKSLWAGDLIRPEEEGMDRDLDGLPPEDHERIIEHGYEPGADYGIEDEGAPQPDRPESGDVGPRDFAPVEGEDQGGYPQAGDIGEPHGHPEQGELAPTELAPREPVQPDLSPDLGAETDAERRAREGRKAIQESQQLPRAHGRRAQREADEGLFAPEKPADGDLFGGVNEPDTPLFQRREPAFYSALNRSVEQLPQGKASPEQWSGILDNLRNKGVKQEEIDWSGVKDWLASRSGPIRKADLLDYLRANEVHVQEVERGGGPVIDRARELAEKENGAGSWERIGGAGQEHYFRDAERELKQRRPPETKFASYTLPGGKNYRELLLTLPERPRNTYEAVVSRLNQKYGEGFDTESLTTSERQEYDAAWARYTGNPTATRELEFRNSHFDEPNVLAHVRFDDRTSPNGERILHMAEVQSDWGQKLRRTGPRMSQEELQTGLRQLSEQRMRLAMDGKAVDAPEVRDIDRQVQELKDRYVKAAHAPPAMPFKTAWPELAMKRMLRYAAEHGYDKLTWDTGATQADRYDLSHHLDRIEYEPAGDGKFEVHAFDRSGKKVIEEDEVVLDRVEELFGKDIAKRIEDGHGDRVHGNLREWRSLSGLDLKVGGEGMRGFYDKILPAFLNKYAKKWGARVEGASLPQLSRDDVAGRIYGRGETYAQLPESSRAAVDKVIADNSAPAHSIAITPAMRESVMQGQPMFVRRGEDVPLHASPYEKITPMVWQQVSDELAPHREQLAGELRARLDQMGLHDIAARVADRVFDAHDPKNPAAVDGVTLGKTITVALDALDHKAVLDHEAIHALRNLGLFTDREWAILEDRSRKDWMARYGVDDRYSDVPLAQRLEEGVAFAFSHMDDAPQPGIVQRIYSRFRNAVSAIGNAARGLGFDSADSIFSRVRSGEVGARSRDFEAEGSGPQFAQRVGSPPANIDEVGDRIDSAAEDLAGELKGAPPGVYRRKLAEMTPPSGEYRYLVPNSVQDWSIRPESVSRLDTRSARVWMSHRAQESMGNALVDELREKIADTVLKLPEKDRRQVYAAREIDRINGITRTDDGRSIVARNDKADFARHSKPGDVVKLTPDQTKAYHALTGMFDRAWKNVMEGAARKVGWDGAWDRDDMGKNLAALQDAAQHSLSDRGLKPIAERALKIVSNLDAHRRAAYHPLMRFGDYFVHVVPREATDKGSRGGGYPPSAWFQLAEPELRDRLLGGSRIGNEAPRYAKPMLEDVGSRFPADKYRITHGFLAHNPEIMDKVDIPAIERLMMFTENDMIGTLRDEAVARGVPKKEAMGAAQKQYDDLYGHLIDRVWERAFQQLEAGYKKQSHTVPGYSEDFDRALGSYMHWTSRNVADQVNRRTVDDAHLALDADPRVNGNVKRYWAKWREAKEEPSSVWNRAVNGVARWAFLESMGLNPSSTAVVGTHGLFMAGPTLSVGIGMKRAGAAYFTAFKHAMGAVRVDGDGIHIDDVGKAARTPEERAFLQQLDREGWLHSRAINDMAALNEKQSDLWGSARTTMRKVMDLALSNVSFMDRANRIASALSSYRLAGDPKMLNAMDRAWRPYNQTWRDIAEHQGVNRESMARFMVPNMVGEYGWNRAPVERNAVARLSLGMHGFVTRLLSNMIKLGHTGPQGRMALMWTLGAFWTMAGADGIPFATDVQNGVDLLWKILSGGKDPMLAYRVQASLASVFGKTGAEMILHGPVSTVTGVNVASRLGLGDLISRSWPTAENTLGAYPSILAGRVIGAIQQARSGQYAAAAAEALPGGLRNAALAAIERENGVKTRRGRTLVRPERLTPMDTTAKALGFTPQKVEHAYQQSDFYYRAKQARMRAPRNPIPKD